MSQSSQSPEPSKQKQPVNNLAIFSIGGQVGCATLLVVFLALFVGIGLDRLLDTKPLFTIIFVLGSAPLALIITFWLAMRTVKSINPQETETKQGKPVEEEEKSE
jgi:F0F1-type ATP synthase assembly protein I